MAEFPALPLWTDAYLGDTTHLTTIEHGAYLLLLMAMWRTPDKRLPTDDAKLARYSRLTKGQWARMKPTIMAFFNERNGFISQGRLTDEATAVRQNSAKQSDKAKARWLKNKETVDAVAKPEPCRNDASLTLPKEDSDANASGVPPVGVDPAKVVFDQGVKLMGSVGITEAKARPMLGRWRKLYGDAALIEALHRASVTAAIDIPSFIEGYFRKRAKTNGNRNGNAFVEGAAELLREMSGASADSRSGGGGQRPDDVPGEWPLLSGRLEPAAAE